MSFRLLFHLLRLGRLHFLVGGVLLHALGIAIALYQGANLDVVALVWGQVAITATQAMTHYSNDYFDLEADRANQTHTAWSGGSRVLADGALLPQWALRIAVLLALVALTAAAILAFRLQTGPWTLPLLLLAVAGAWFYSAPPLRLHSRGVGELTVALLVPVLTVLVGYYLQAGRLTWLPVQAATPLALFQFLMLLAIEFPDRMGDEAVGKRTLVVRLGPSGAGRLFLGVLAAAYLVLPLLVITGLPLRVATWTLFFTLIPGLWFLWRLIQGAGSSRRWWSWMGFLGVALVVGTTVVELVAFLSLIR